MPGTTVFFLTLSSNKGTFLPVPWFQSSFVAFTSTPLDGLDTLDTLDSRSTLDLRLVCSTAGMIPYSHQLSPFPLIPGTYHHFRPNHRQGSQPLLSVMLSSICPLLGSSLETPTPPLWTLVHTLIPEPICRWICHLSVFAALDRSGSPPASCVEQGPYM